MKDGHGSCSSSFRSPTRRSRNRSHLIGGGSGYHSRVPGDTPENGDVSRPDPKGVTRRCFLEWSLLVGSALSSLPPSLLADSDPWGASLAPTPDGFGGASLAREASRILRVGCPSHNCGGRCLLKLHIENGVIVRIDTDDASADTMPKAVEPAGE